MRVETRPFDEADLPRAGALLAERHARHRKVSPLLDARFEDPDIAAGEIAAVLSTDGASAAVAERDGEVVGYLAGAPKDPSWGPNMWVEAAGHAVTEPEVARDLYAYLAAGWVEAGIVSHYVLLPTADPALVDAWSRLSFGKQHQHAIRPAATGVRDPGDIVVRRAARSDIPVLAALEVALPTHQGQAPVFSSGQIPVLEEAIAEWEDDFDDPVYTTFVAELNGAVVGSAIGVPLTKSGAHKGLALAPDAGFLGFAAVLPEARGHGVGSLLGEVVTDWAAREGYVSVATDWRVTNLLSSRTWPRLGYEPTFVRMHRYVG